MITFGLNYDVKSAHIDEFLEVCQNALKVIDTMDGHQQTRLFNDVNKPNSYLIYSDWDTQEHFSAFMRSPEFKSVQNMSRDMLEDRPKHQIYETKKMGR